MQSNHIGALSPALVKVLQCMSVEQLNILLAASGQQQLPPNKHHAVCTACGGVDGSWILGFAVSDLEVTVIAHPDGTIAAM